MPQIINRLRPPLPSYAEAVLCQLFPDCETVYVSKYFTEGLSGSWVILVRPILKTGVAKLPVVVKIDWGWRVDREWRAYSAHIRNQLPYCADIQTEPEQLKGGDYGGLIYSLVGGDQFTIESLLQFLLETETPKIEKLLNERLFANLNALWRATKSNQYEMHVETQYDAMLPINFVLDWVPDESELPCKTISPKTIDPNELNFNDIVQVSGFQVVNISYEANRISLDIPTGNQQACRFHIKRVPHIDRYEIGMIIDEPLTGQLVDTRQNQLKAFAEKLLEPSADLAASRIKLLDSNGQLYPNPLTSLSKVLDQTYDVHSAYIHGDLHLNNVVVEGENFVVIDFAHARKDHLIRDLIHLESAVITQLLPHYLDQADQALPSLVTLLQQLHLSLQYSQLNSPAGLEKPFAILKGIRTTAQSYLFKPNQWQEYYNGLFIYLLGSIRYDSLNRFAKQLAFWGAATILELMENPPQLGAILLDEKETKGELMSSQSQETKNSPDQTSNSGSMPHPEDKKWTISLDKESFRRKLSDYFSMSELKTLAFDLGIDYEDFGPVGKEGFIRALINKAASNHQIERLLKKCKAERPHVSWA